MESAISLENLLGFDPSLLPLTKAMHKRDADVVELVTKALEKAAAHYEDREESFGPQELAHLAWLYVEAGNYFQEIGQEKKARDSYREAYALFADPENRGHAPSAAELAREHPYLLEPK